MQSGTKLGILRQEYLRCIVVTPVIISRPMIPSLRKHAEKYCGDGKPVESFNAWWKHVLSLKKRYQDMPKEALEYFRKSGRYNSTWYQSMEDAINTRLRAIQADKVEDVKIIAVGTGEEMYERGMIILRENE